MASSAVSAAASAGEAEADFDLDLDRGDSLPGLDLYGEEAVLSPDAANWVRIQFINPKGRPTLRENVHAAGE